MRSIKLFTLMLISGVASAQNPSDFKFVDFDNKRLITSIELSPDQKTLAIGTMGGPVVFYDWKNNTTVKKIKFGGYNKGTKISYSKDGKYLLLEKLYDVEFAANKDNNTLFEVLDLSTEKIIFRRDEVESAVLTPDNHLVTLEDNKISEWDIQNGKELRFLEIKKSRNAIALSPDGKLLAVSQKPELTDLDKMKNIRNDKGLKKEITKVRNIVDFYDFGSFKELYKTNNVTDVIYNMKFSRDGAYLWAYTVPDVLYQTTAAGMPGAIVKINAQNGNMERLNLQTVAEIPEYKESEDMNSYAVTSLELIEASIPQIFLYQYNSGVLLKKFDIRSKQTQVKLASRTSFAFLPDNSTMVIGYGYELIYLNYK